MDQQTGWRLDQDLAIEAAREVLKKKRLLEQDTVAFGESAEWRQHFIAGSLENQMDELLEMGLISKAEYLVVQAVYWQTWGNTTGVSILILAVKAYMEQDPPPFEVDENDRLTNERWWQLMARNKVVTNDEYCAIRMSLMSQGVWR